MTAAPPPNPFQDKPGGSCIHSSQELVDSLTATKRIEQWAEGARSAAAASVRRVVCYTRTANTGTGGLRLLERQHARLHAVVVMHGWTVLAWVEDLHESGTTLARPGLQRALALLADHQADALLATDMSRLAVDPEVAVELATLADRHGWRILTVAPAWENRRVGTDTPIVGNSCR
jgi:Resolvase, N terminal domain